MATNGMKEVGIRLKVGATGTEAVDKLAASLRVMGADTEALDAKAHELGAEMVATAGASTELAQAQDKLAPITRDAAKAADNLAAAAQQGGKDLGTLGEGSEAARRKLGDMKVELAAAGAAAYTIGRALGSAAQDAAAFETGMAEVSTLVSDTSGMTAQAEAVRALAREYGGDAAAQARALYQIISAGAKEGAEATGILDQANRLAVGGVTDITTAADGLTSILNAYGDKAGTAAQVSDALFVAMKAGKTTVGELSNSIGQVAPISAQAGVGLEQLLAATAALTKGGTSTSESMTQLRGLITAVINPSAEAAKIAADLGIAFDAQALKAKGLAGFLSEVQAKTGGNTEVMAKMFGSVEALGAVLALTGSQAGSFRDVLQGMESRAGATDEAFAKMAQTSGFAGKQFQAALDDARISMGQALTALTPLLQAVTSAINLFNGMPEPARAAAAGVVAVGLVVGPLALSVGILTRAVTLSAAAMGTQAAAAAASVGPLTAAAVATNALATASARAAPLVAAAVGAGGALAGMVRALGAAFSFLTGPIGLTLTGLSLLIPEFLRAKKAAEDSDEAVRKMLAGPDESQLPAKAAEAAKATEDVAKAANDAAEKHQSLEVAARLAAAALGVEMAAATNKVSLEFGKQLVQLDDLTAGLPKLKAAGVDTAKVLSEALTKLFESAKNQAELDVLRFRVEALGAAGKLSAEQQKKADEDLEKAKGLLAKTLDNQEAATKRTNDALKAQTALTKAQLELEITKLRLQRDEMVQQGAISSANEIDLKIRDLQLRITENGTAAKRAEAVAMRESILRQAEDLQSRGLLTGTLKQELNTRLLQADAIIAETDAAQLNEKQLRKNQSAHRDGTQTRNEHTKATEDGSTATRSNTGALQDNNRELSNAKRLADEAAAAARRWADAVDAVNPRLVSGNGLAGFNNPGANTPDGLPPIDSFGNLIKSTKSGDITRTAEGPQAVSPGDGWTYTLDPYQIVTKGIDAQGNPVPGGWMRTPQPTRGLTGGDGFAGLPTLGSGGAAFNPADPFGNTARAADSGASYNVNVTIGGVGYGIAAANRKSADDMVSALERAFQLGGGGF